MNPGLIDLGIVLELTHELLIMLHLGFKFNSTLIYAADEGHGSGRFSDSSDERMNGMETPSYARVSIPLRSKSLRKLAVYCLTEFFQTLRRRRNWSRSPPEMSPLVL
jgi:hypothetical protein